MEVQDKITGYRQLTPAETDLINAIKAHADSIGLVVETLANDMTAAPGKPASMLIDKRWVGIARTHLQQGFMALVRSVAQPTGF